MRTRTRTTRINDRIIAVQPQINTGTLQQVTPGVVGSSLFRGMPSQWKTVPVEYPAFIQEQYCYDTDTIVDEQTPGRGIKNCSHVKFKTFRAERVPVACYANTTRLSWAYGGQQVIVPYVRSTDTLVPAHAIWAACDGPIGSPIISRVNEDTSPSQLGLSDPPDMLAKVPSVLVRKMEQVHLSTMAIEARELPALWSLFTKRGAIAAGLNTLRNLRRGTPKETLRRLLKEYRETQLGMSYGLFPTVNDLQALNREILGKGIRDKPYTVTATIRGRAERDKLHTFVINSYEIHSAARMEHCEVMRVDGAHATCLRPKPLTKFFRDAESFIDSLVGVNPMGLAWEVIPFAFMVDYVMSIDDLLDTLWLNSQTQYQVGFWSSTKRLYRRTCNGRFYVDCTGYYPEQPTWQTQVIRDLSCEKSWYSRLRRAAPSPLNSLSSRLNPRNLFLSALVALGFAK